MTVATDLGPQLPALLKAADVERIVGLSRRTIDRLCHAGAFPQPIRIGCSRRWRREDIVRLLGPAEAMPRP